MGEHTMNTSIHLVKRPREEIIPGETFEVRRSPIPRNEDVKDDEVLVRVEYLSVDPGAVPCWRESNDSYEGISERCTKLYASSSHR